MEDRMPVLPTPEAMTELCRGTLPAQFGIVFRSIEPGLVVATMTVEARFLAPNGVLHAGTLVTLADTTCGAGTLSALRAGTNFSTIELKTNFLGTVRDGELICTATAQHLGRATQVWDAEVVGKATGKRLALFRCTQMILG